MASEMSFENVDGRRRRMPGYNSSTKTYPSRDLLSAFRNSTCPSILSYYYSVCVRSEFIVKSVLYFEPNG